MIDLRGGDDLLAAARSLHPGGLIEVHGAFPPGPAMRALRGEGLEATQLNDGMIRAAQPPLPHVEDLTWCEPPQPFEWMVRAFVQLAPGNHLIAALPRYPRMLVPELEKRGAHFEIALRPDTTALVWMGKPG